MEISTRVQQILGTTNEDLVRSVVTDLRYSGDPELVLSNEDLIRRLGDKYKQRLEGSKKRVSAEDGNICPICNLPLKPVKLSGDRMAMWCSKHFVVFPTKPN
jgi:hypothetical protein